MEHIRPGDAQVHKLLYASLSTMILASQLVDAAVAGKPVDPSKLRHYHKRMEELRAAVPNQDVNDKNKEHVDWLCEYIGYVYYGGV